MKAIPNQNVVYKLRFHSIAKSSGTHVLVRATASPSKSRKTSFIVTDSEYNILGTGFSYNAALKDAKLSKEVKKELLENKYVYISKSYNRDGGFYSQTHGEDNRQRFETLEEATEANKGFEIIIEE